MVGVTTFRWKHLHPTESCALITRRNLLIFKKFEMRVPKQRGKTVKLPSLSSLVGALFALLSALVLASCGGGGAAGNPTAPGGTLQISPSTATMYAGVPMSFTIFGGRKPYQLTTNEPNVLPVPSTVDGNSFVLLGNNPGVIDAGLQPGDLPVRTVNLTARSGDGQTLTVPVKVAQNFLTGYGATFSPSACPVPSGGTAPTGNVACGGGETAVRFAATTNGVLHGDEAFNLSIVRGNAILVDPSTGANGATITVRSDHSGEVTAIIRTSANQPTQLGVLRIQEVSTGVYTDTVFIITGNTSATTLTAIPSTFTFTGATTADCGVGSGTFLVFDGTPPYTAVSSNTSLVTVTPASSSSQPGRFQITAGNAFLCGNASIIVSDALGARTTVTVNTAVGSAAPPTPPTPIQISPSSITLSCSQTGSVSVAGGGSGGSGGSATFSASTTDPNLTATVTGATLSVTRAGPAGPGTGTTTSTVTVTDGSSFATLSVSSPTTCP